MKKIAMLLLLILVVGCGEDMAVAPHEHYTCSVVEESFGFYTGVYVVGAIVDIPCGGRYVIDDVDTEQAYVGVEIKTVEHMCYLCLSSFESKSLHYKYVPRVKSLRLLRECDLEERYMSFAVFNQMGGHIIP